MGDGDGEGVADGAALGVGFAVTAACAEPTAEAVLLGAAEAVLIGEAEMAKGVEVCIGEAEAPASAVLPMERHRKNPPAPNAHTSSTTAPTGSSRCNSLRRR